MLYVFTTMILKISFFSVTWQKRQSKISFTSKVDLTLRKKLVKCYICSIALYGGETWSRRKVDQKLLERFEMWPWRKTEISWPDLVRNNKCYIESTREKYLTYNRKKE